MSVDGGAAKMIPRVNSVEISCDLRVKECFEVRASLVTPADDSIKADFDALFAHLERYAIASFEGGVLIARSATLAYDLEIRIDTIAKSAQRFARGKKERESPPSTPTVQQVWVLK